MARPVGEPLKVGATIMDQGVVAIECNRCGALVLSESRQEAINFSRAHVVEHGANPRVTKDQKWQQ
jgi:hypothetical protein